jgi:hypothetical protein
LTILLLLLPLLLLHYLLPTGGKSNNKVYDGARHQDDILDYILGWKESSEKDTKAEDEVSSN